MKRLMAVMLVLGIGFIQACSSASYTVKSSSGEFTYHGKVWESVDELSRANLRAAEARKVEAEAELVKAYAEAITKDPSLARDLPLPGNPNDRRNIYRDSWEGKSEYSYSNGRGYKFDPRLSIQENANSARATVCAESPSLPGCR